MAFYYNDGKRRSTFRKFGETDAAVSGYTVWPVAADFVVPTSAAATTVVSTDANDTADGTGVRTVQIIGISDASDGYATITETVTLNGLTPVNCQNNFWIINRMKTLTTGSGRKAAGVIEAKHGSTVLAHIEAGENITLQLIYAVPGEYASARFDFARLNLGKTGAAAFVEVTLQVWEPDYPFWVSLNKDYLITSGSSLIEMSYLPTDYPPGTVFRMQVEEASGAGLHIGGTMYFGLLKE